MKFYIRMHENNANKHYLYFKSIYAPYERNNSTILLKLTQTQITHNEKPTKIE